MPYFLRNAGVSVENIGWFVTASMLPAVAIIAYAPIVDVGPSRRSWLILMTVLSAACLSAALALPLPSSATAFPALTVAGQVLTGLVGSSNGGLMAAVLADRERGEGGGWYNAGNLGGGPVGAWVVLSIASCVSANTRAITLGLLMIVPSLAALAVSEPERPKYRGVADHLRAMWADV